MLDVRYSCYVCGLEEVTVTVPYRDPMEDVRLWMERRLIPSLLDDHLARSPDCLSDELAEIRIPVEGARWLGGPRVQ